ncbi:MAG: metallophosphoesterase [Clostridia bacterium]|nr:metallophosphoesterase [Clostridia bacterium]
MKLPVLREYTLNSKKIKKSTSFIMLSDLHATEYGEELLVMTRKLSPDFVVFAGDMGDEGKAAVVAEKTYAQFGKAFPCYAVMGNHEFSGKVAGRLERACMECGVKVLHGDRYLQNGILLCGIDDIAAGKATWENEKQSLREIDDSLFSVLISHRPDFHAYYRESGFDLVVCGHTHGGQLRFGKINGVYAPGQGIFPKYAGGLYSLGKTNMIVGRGLVQNRLPRWGNPPELILVRLEKEDGDMGYTR